MTASYWAREYPTVDDVLAAALVGPATGDRVVYLVGDGFRAPEVSPAVGDRWTAQVTGGEAEDPAGAWRWHVSAGDSVVVIVVLANDVGHLAGPWWGLTPAELAGAFTAFWKLLGVPWSHSTGVTAQRLIMATHPRAAGGRALETVDELPEPALGSTLELPWQAWARPLTKLEGSYAFVHAYDANAQYLGAWGTVELGHGRPVHKLAPTFTPNRAGLWRIPKVDSIRNLHEQLPPAWLPGREWFTTPTVTRLLEDTDGLNLPMPLISEAWVWPERSRYLRTAAERLRDARAIALTTITTARQQLSDVTPPGDAGVYDVAVRRLVRAQTVYDAIKDVYRVETGRFGMGGAVGKFARPDWGHTIRAQARVNLHRRLTKLGAAPFAIATDGLLFATDDPDPVSYAERIRLPINSGLGSFRFVGSLPMNELPEKSLDAFKRF